MPQHPNCPYGADTSQCRVTAVNSIQQPQIAWTPEYDGMGAMTNTDPNTYVSDYTCRICGGEWTETRSGSGSTPSVRSKQDPSTSVPPAAPASPGAAMAMGPRQPPTPPPEPPQPPPEPAREG
jgi:hypothetical protein